MNPPRASWPRPPSGRTGYDVSPHRPRVVTLLLFAFVVLVASATAQFFKSILLRLIRFYSDRADPTTASAELGWLTLFVLATASVAVAAAIGHHVQRRWSGRVGIEAVAASARGEGRSISLRATVLRVIATFTASAGLVSIGRESAIVEAGGTTGAVTGRESGGRGDALAAAGVAAAFASAYHSPIAAILYAEEHLRIRQSVRATAFVVTGGIAGHALTAWLFEREPIFPDVQGAKWHVAALGLAILIPAVVVAKAFYLLRVRVTADALVRRLHWPKPVIVGALAVLAGLTVATFPLASGNGMDALDRAPDAATTTLAVALLVGKLVGTTAALGAGAPGGVLSPTMGVAAGAALLVVLGADGLGIAVDHPWDAMVPAMAIGVAIGMRSPLVAIFLVPELLGDYWLVLPVAVVVGVAWLLDRVLDLFILRTGAAVPTGVYDEDA